MASWIDSSYPPTLTPEQEEYLLDNLKNWSIANGLAVRPTSAFVPEETDPSMSLATTAPVTLFPSPFPRKCFDMAKDLQVSYNELYAAISSDEAWLKDIVEEIIDVDDFVAKLWSIHLDVKEEGYVQDLTFGLFRSDYMVHSPTSSSNEPSSPPSIKQVEFNTISSSFGCLSSQVSLLHQHLHELPATPYPTSIKSASLPSNPTIPKLAQGLKEAHIAYGPSKSVPSLPLCIIILVQPKEHNIFDQYLLTNHIQNDKIPIFRLPFTTVLDHTKIPSSNPSRPLVYTPPHSPSTPYEVSVLYFRAGYAPSEYPDSTVWTARHHLERSAAIKCPSVLTQISGIKKVQQMLAIPHSVTSDSDPLTHFLPHTSSSDLSRIRSTFCAQYPLFPLDSPSAKEGRALALDSKTAPGFVLKPNREGGGNNIYGSDIPDFLKSIPEDQWKGYILMSLIEPPAEGMGVQNAVFRNGKVEKGEVIGELGVFGCCLWRQVSIGSNKSESANQGIIKGNFEAGYLLRTKGRGSSEGGVAAGFGSVDSCLLID
ncbi:MAG: hypothetical protein M1834_008036 [Cirrosporium novae-zelandiae]|nr:MAG: hypothetical protein M1834_008036 [Cirrosporium novae-zelandiae]